MSTRARLLLPAVVALALGAVLVPARRAVAVPAPAAPDSADTTVVAGLVRDAVALAPLFNTPVVGEFLAAAPRLPEPAPRVVWRDSTASRWFDEAEFAALDEAERAGLVRRDLPARFWYYTGYGTPLAYARALEVLGEAGLASLRGRRVLDFGYGGAGSISLLGQAGAVAVGVDVDPRLRALYAGDPSIEGWTSPAGGRARTVHGRWPAEAAAREAVGAGYDLVLSKNTLKRGYVHPERPADPRQLVDLGVDDTTFVRELHRILVPGGRALIYNLSPAPSPPDQPYRPWTDGRCPFARALFEENGFRVLAYDANDDRAARAMGRALGWDRGAGGMDLEHDLFGRYTLVERLR